MSSRQLSRLAHAHLGPKDMRFSLACRGNSILKLQSIPRHTDLQWISSDSYLAQGLVARGFNDWLYRLRSV